MLNYVCIKTVERMNEGSFPFWWLQLNQSWWPTQNVQILSKRLLIVIFQADFSGILLFKRRISKLIENYPSAVFTVRFTSISAKSHVQCNIWELASCNSRTVFKDLRELLKGYFHPIELHFSKKISEKFIYCFCSQCTSPCLPASWYNAAQDINFQPISHISNVFSYLIFKVI